MEALTLPEARGVRASPWIAVAGTLSLGVAVDALAQERTGAGTFQVNAGIGYTDNLTRNPEAIEETFLEVGLDAQLAVERQRMTASLNGSLSHSEYDDPRVTSAMQGNLYGVLSVAVVPEVFDWVTTSNVGTVRSDILLSSSPANREYLRVFTTGPDFFVPLGDRTRFNISGRFENRQWEESERLDSEVMGHTIGLSRFLRPTQTIGINGSHRRVEFDDSSVLPYETDSVYLSYDRELATGGLSMNLGETELQFVDETRDGPLVALSWDRAIGRRSRLSLFARQDFEDPGDQFAEGLSADLGVEGDAPSSPDPRIRRTAGIEYGLGRERARMSWLLSRNSDHAAVEVETETPVQEREGARVAMTFAYPFGQAWMMNVGAALVREEVTDFEGVSNQREAYVDFSRALGRSLSLSIEYDRFERDSDFGEQGDEHRILLSLAWVAN